MAHVKIINSFSRLSEHGNVFWETLYKKLISRRPDTLKYFSNTETSQIQTAQTIEDGDVDLF
ncbi:hypothetical protein PS1M3_09530 [Pseudoalteromonas sp. PS1M3]|jgi:hemoglobin-like flavoprotein|nr:hypothetical protein PS1M3_09530 [Pseudoalteromonas sp. PS1M3]